MCVVTDVKAILKRRFAEEHVYGVDPSKVQAEQVIEQRLAGAHFSPLELGCIGPLTTLAFFGLIVKLESVDDIKQAAFIGRNHVHIARNGNLLAEPSGNLLTRLAGPKFTDDLAIMPVTSNLIEDDLLPLLGSLKIVVSLLQVRGIFRNLLVDALQARVVLSQLGDFSKEEFFVGFGMGLISASEIAHPAARAWIWVLAVTLREVNVSR